VPRGIKALVSRQFTNESSIDRLRISERFDERGDVEIVTQLIALHLAKACIDSVG